MAHRTNKSGEIAPKMMGKIKPKAVKKTQATKKLKSASMKYINERKPTQLRSADDKMKGVRNEC